MMLIRYHEAAEQELLHEIGYLIIGWSVQAIKEQPDELAESLEP